MEKVISYSQFQSVKNVAKAMDPIMRKFEPIRKKMEALKEEAEGYQKMIDALEQGIVSITGFHVADLVKKVVEVTGTTADGKPIKSTKFLPTDIVKYDEAKKQYVVTVPDPVDELAALKKKMDGMMEQEDEENTEEPLRVPAESAYGSDFDLDKEKIQQEADHGDFLQPTEMGIFD